MRSTLYPIPLGTLAKTIIGIVKPKISHRRRLNQIVARISSDGQLASSFLDGAANKMMHYVEEVVRDSLFSFSIQMPLVARQGWIVPFNVPFTAPSVHAFK